MSILSHKIVIHELCCAKIASRFEDWSVHEINHPLNPDIDRCLTESRRNRWIRASRGDELGTDRNRRVLPPTCSSRSKQRAPAVPSVQPSEIGRRNQSAVSSGLFPSFTRRSFPTGIRDGGRREPLEPRPCSLGRRNVCPDLAAVGIPQQVQESPVRGSNVGALGCSASPTLPGFCAGVSRPAES